MSNDDQNKINISKEEIFSGRIKDETVSEMAKITAKQIYWQGFNAGVEAADLALHERLEYPTKACAIVRSLKK